jgi:hypothetical protein
MHAHGGIAGQGVVSSLAVTIYGSDSPPGFKAIGLILLLMVCIMGDPCVLGWRVPGRLPGAGLPEIKIWILICYLVWSDFSWVMHLQGISSVSGR